MFRSKLPWIIALVFCLASIFVISGFRNEKSPVYSLNQAQFYMQTSNWDSAKIHAVHVLADEEHENSISLARTIISLANENIELEMKERAEIKRMAFEMLSARYDKQDKILWYRDASSPEYESAPAFYLYLGKREEDVWMRFRAQYSGDEYIFLNQILIETEESGYAFVPKEQVHRNHGNKLVWEWMDESFTPDLYDMFYDIAHSKRASIRFLGTNSFEEREITEEEKEALQKVLKAYALSQEEL